MSTLTTQAPSRSTTPTAQSTGIVAEGLTKIFTTRKRLGWLRTMRDEQVAVAGLDLHIPPGQVTGLLGLNGAGKTTTIKMLSTLLLPTSGQVTVDNLDLVRDAATIRRRVNMIAGGERMVYWRLTGRENLWYFAQLYDVERRGLDERIAGLLRLVGLTDAADTPVERYSKGMKQRLQIARGLINDPRYLFLDEPTLGLDAPIARELRRVVRNLAEEGRGILLTSHYLQEVEELCAHIYVINRGHLIAQGSPAELKMGARRDRTVRVRLPDLPPAVAGALTALASETDAKLEITMPESTGDRAHAETIDETLVTLRHPDDLTGRVAAAIALNGGSLLALEALEPTLEDALLALATANEAINDQEA